MQALRPRLSLQRYSTTEMLRHADTVVSHDDIGELRKSRVPRQVLPCGDGGVEYPAVGIVSGLGEIAVGVSVLCLGEALCCGEVIIVGNRTGGAAEIHQHPAAEIRYRLEVGAYA